VENKYEKKNEREFILDLRGSNILMAFSMPTESKKFYHGN